MEDLIIALLLLLLVLVVIFIVTRAFWLWYWKVNHIVSNLEMMNQNLEELKALLVSQNSISSRAVHAVSEDELPDL